MSAQFDMVSKIPIPGSRFRNGWIARGPLYPDSCYFGDLLIAYVFLFS